MTQTFAGPTEISHLSAATINALVAQKDHLMELISTEDDAATRLVAAKTLLDVLHPLWNTVGYGYKGRELYRLIRTEARNQAALYEELAAEPNLNSWREQEGYLARLAAMRRLVQEC